MVLHVGTTDATLMTAFGSIIALSPLAIGIGTGAQMHQPQVIEESNTFATGGAAFAAEGVL